MPFEKTSDRIHLGFTVSTTSQMHTLGSAVSSLCVSYPKAGRTWLRFMMGEYLSGELDPKLHMAFVHDGADGLACDFERAWYDTYPVVVLVRDPRDIVVSHFFQITRRDRPFGHARPPELQRDYPIGEFIRRQDFGIDRVIDFYNEWFLLDHALLISYEQISSSQEVLGLVLRFLGTAVDDNRLSNAVAANTFAQLQRQEREHPTRSELLRPGDPTDPASFKVRRGEVGGHRHYLSHAEIEFLNQRISEALQPGILREWYCDSGTQREST
jgi:hypothetical protein